MLPGAISCQYLRAKNEGPVSVENRKDLSDTRTQQRYRIDKQYIVPLSATDENSVPI
jgi:hypothetical protein